MIPARVATSIAPATAALVPLPSSGSAGSAARSTSCVVAPRAPSALVLVAANLVPLVGVLFFGWSVFSTLLLFWVENVIVCAFNVLRMLVAQPQIGVTWAAKLCMIPFFTFHYGMFVTVHGLFVLTLFGGGFSGRGFPTVAT